MHNVQAFPNTRQECPVFLTSILRKASLLILVSQQDEEAHKDVYLRSLMHGYQFFSLFLPCLSHRSEYLPSWLVIWILLGTYALFLNHGIGHLSLWLNLD